MGGERTERMRETGTRIKIVVRNLQKNISFGRHGCRWNNNKMVLRKISCESMGHRYMVEYRNQERVFMRTVLLNNRFTCKQFISLHVNIK